jgi:hypothetical protein
MLSHMQKRVHEEYPYKEQFHKKQFHEEQFHEESSHEESSHEESSQEGQQGQSRPLWTGGNARRRKTVVGR